MLEISILEILFLGISVGFIFGLLIGFLAGVCFIIFRIQNQYPVLQEQLEKWKEINKEFKKYK
jgi:fructose-specific phosphotransferase system IIC component